MSVGQDCEVYLVLFCHCGRWRIVGVHRVMPNIFGLPESPLRRVMIGLGAPIGSVWMNNLIVLHTKVQSKIPSMLTLWVHNLSLRRPFLASPSAWVKMNTFTTAHGRHIRICIFMSISMFFNQNFYLAFCVWPSLGQIMVIRWNR